LIKLALLYNQWFLVSTLENTGVGAQKLHYTNYLHMHRYMLTP